MAITFPTIKNLENLRRQLNSAFAAVFGEAQTYTAAPTFPSMVIGTVKVVTGSGSPAGVVTAPIGSLYLRSDGGAATSLYVKESGTGSSGWVGK